VFRPGCPHFPTLSRTAKTCRIRPRPQLLCNQRHLEVPLRAHATTHSLVITNNTRIWQHYRNALSRRRSASWRSRGYLLITEHCFSADTGAESLASPPSLTTTIFATLMLRSMDRHNHLMKAGFLLYLRSVMHVLTAQRWRLQAGTVSARRLSYDSSQDSLPHQDLPPKH